MKVLLGADHFLKRALAPQNHLLSITVRIIHISYSFTDHLVRLNHHNGQCSVNPLWNLPTLIGEHLRISQ